MSAPESMTPSRPWWQPGPFDYSKIEMLVMRAAFSVLLFCNIKWETGNYVEQRNPTGLAHFFDFTWLGKHPPGPFWQGLTIVGLVFYVLGWMPALGLLPGAAFALMIGTLITSTAMQHSWHLVTLVALAQFLIYAWPKSSREYIRPSLAVHRLAVYAVTVVIAGAYVVCGIVKLVNSNFQWIQKAPYLSVQVMKSNWASYYDTLEPVKPWLTKATQAMVDYPNVARLFFGTGLLIELAAFVILINRKWAFYGGLAIIALHLSISKVMDLHFEYHMLVVLVFLVNIPGLRRTFQPASTARL